MNHSCDANLWMGDEVTVVARCDIAAGEELTQDYALYTASPTFSMSAFVAYRWIRIRPTSI
jgi:hypothetical protein